MNVEKAEHRGKRVPIYFCSSNHGGRDDQELNRQIIALLEDYGTVLTGHVVDPSLTGDGGGDSREEQIFERDKSKIKACWAVIAEVSTPSIELGMELGYADHWSKPTLCLYRPQPGKKLSAMVRGYASFTVREYARIEEIPELLHEFLRTATMDRLIATLDFMKVNTDSVLARSGAFIASLNKSIALYDKHIARLDEKIARLDAFLQLREHTRAEFLKKLK